MMNMVNPRLVELSKDPELVKQLTPLEKQVLELLLLRDTHTNPHLTSQVAGKQSNNPDDMSINQMMDELKGMLEKDPELRERISPMHRFALDQLLKHPQQPNNQEYILVKRQQWEAILDLLINQLKQEPTTRVKKKKHPKTKKPR
jgi:hypothetical protein